MTAALAARRGLATALVAGALLLGAVAGASAQGTLREFTTRPGVVTRTLEVPAASPRAALLLFAGGDGGVLINGMGSPVRHWDNFAVRTRGQFAEQGLQTYVVDAPSDRQSPPYLVGFRTGPEWAADVRSLVQQVHRATGLPVWLLGTSASSGAMAVAGAKVQDEPGFGGIVMTSTCVAVPNALPMAEWGLEKLQAPVLLVHHRQEQCRFCAPGEMEGVLARIPAARKELLWFDGGRTAGDVCGPRGYHGYNGIEGDVVTAIGRWIAATPKK